MRKCDNCGSTNINYQVTSNTHSTNEKGIIALLFSTIAWIIAFPLMLLGAIFGGNKNKTVTRTENWAVCQNCGKKWRY